MVEVITNPHDDAENVTTRVDQHLKPHNVKAQKLFPFSTYFMDTIVITVNVRQCSGKKHTWPLQNFTEEFFL